MYIIGTSHFESFSSALKYYRPYFGDPVFRRRNVGPYTFRNNNREKACMAWVQAKLESGEIHLGKPALKEGEKLHIKREEGRYFIQAA